jgi:hypothetical protein
MPGDAFVPRPTNHATLAINIDARPEHVWPWIVQMGYQRGGLYSYDWLDRLFGYLDGPSADRILPEFQSLTVGDVIPMGRGLGFSVKQIDPGHSLVLGGEEGGVRWEWNFGLYRIDETRTRLISRYRATMPRTIRGRLFWWLLAPAAYIMTRRMLLGLKVRAEALAADASKNIVRAA